MVNYEKLEKELVQAQSVEEIQEILNNNGVEMTMDEVQIMLRKLVPQDELTEDDLDEVAGGVRWSTIVRIICRIVAGIIRYIKQYAPW